MRDSRHDRLKGLEAHLGIKVLIKASGINILVVTKAQASDVFDFHQAVKHIAAQNDVIRVLRTWRECSL